MSSTTQHEVKAASAVLADDVICQSFIQSSSTLAYACLLIRQKKYELATHVLHSLEAKQASRFKDMVFYLQVQIGIETGEYAVVKKRLVPRVNQHPNDMVALSLLEADIHLEWVAWQARQPGVEPGMAAAVEAPLVPSFTPSFQASPPSFAEPSQAAPALGSEIGRITKSSHSVASAAAPASLFSGAAPATPYASTTPAAPAMASAPSAPASHYTPPIQASVLAPMTASASPRSPSGVSAYAGTPPVVSTGSSVTMSAADPLDSDFGVYQALASDENTQALSLGNRDSGRFRFNCRNGNLEPLVNMLPQLVPGAIAHACASLESGDIHKICFSFQNMTVTSFHKGAEQLALVTGNINHSLLTMVRAENIFQKQAASAQARVRLASQAVEGPVA